MFERFVTWCKADPPDVGNQTRAVLSSGVAWDRAAADYAAAGHRSAGNGSLMRATPAAIYFARSELAETMDAARRISALTHGDRAAGEGCAIFHGLMATALTGGDVLSALWSVLQRVARPWREKWETVLDPAWEPSMAEEGNGAVWPTLGSAVWALRTTTTFEDAVRSAVDLGYDTDTVGAVTGALAGAVHGITAVPLAWSSKLNGTVPGHGDRVWRLPDLHLLAGRLIDRS